MSDLRLVPVSGPTIEVENDQSMVGRDPSCEIVVTDGSVSRRHARLERRGPAWWVVDQGSANGTYVNSLRIAEQELRPGQELRFGALSYRVEIEADPEATVATPFLADDSATLMAPLTPPPAPPASLPPPIPGPPPVAPKPAVLPTPPRATAATPPPAPPSAAAARERFKQPGAGPVPQMPAGAPPAKKGRSPLFWVAIGCCGCLLVVVLLISVIGGGAYMATRPVSNAAQGWLAEVRQSRLDEASAGLSGEYRSRLSPEELQTLVEAIQRSKDASFLSRSVDNDKAVLKGVLTGAGAPQPITIQLVKEGGAWKVDDVRLGVE